MMKQDLRRISLTGVLMALLLVMAGCGSEPAATTITAADLADRIGNGTAPAIFDVRTPAEYVEGHIPGAINIPHTDVAERAGEFSVYKDREVVVYCGSGKRAAMAEADLAAAGFGKVLDLDGHMKVWKAEGYPLDQAAELN